MLLRCRSCGESKDEKLFTKSSGYNYYIQCKACKNRVNKKHYHKHKEKYWGDALRKYSYNGDKMTGDIYNRLLDKQAGKCAICGRVPEERIRKNGAVVPAGRLDVDHVHDDSNEVRGLLCPTCNKRLGSLNYREDALVWLENAKKYVDTWEV